MSPVNQPRFWKRQFAGEPTQPQVTFDFVFGVAAPFLCFLMDPIAFHGGVLGRPLFGEYQVFAYLISGLEMATLLLCLTSRSRFLNNFVAGVLLAGGLFSALLGFLLAPYSLVGLMVVIGVLGFTPFFTAFVYLRNSYRAVAKKADLAVPGRAVSALLLGCMVTLTGTYGVSQNINRMVERSVTQIISGDDQQALAAARRIRHFSFLATAQMDRVVDEYRKYSIDEADKQRLAKSYELATGEDLEQKVRRLMD